MIIISISGTILAETIIEGEIKGDIRSRIKNGEYIYNEENLLIKYKANLSENLEGYASINFRYQNFSQITTPYNLNNRYNVEPLEIQLKEGYIDYYNFLIKRFDLRVG